MTEKVEYYSDGEGRHCRFVDGRFVEGDPEYAKRIQEMKDIVERSND